MALTRLWDTRSNVASIPTLQKTIGKDTFQRFLEITTERRKRQSFDTLIGNCYTELANNKSTPLREEIRKSFKKIDAVKASEPLQRLKKFRDEILAHSEEPNGTFVSTKRIPYPVYGDEQKVLDETIPIVSSLYEIVTGTTHDFSSTVSVWDERQADLWAIVRSAANGHIFVPRKRSAGDLIKSAPKDGGTIVIRG